MKIFNTQQIRDWDAFTIQNEPIPSLELMERASKAFVDWFSAYFSSTDTPIYVYCGNGNNGGDGLAIGRLLRQKYDYVHLVVLTVSGRRSKDNQTNLIAAQKMFYLDMITLSEEDEFPSMPLGSIAIDALFGTGFKGELQGYHKTLVNHLNQLEVLRVAVDIPSGLMADEHSLGEVFHANYTITFEQPKLAFLFPENAKFVGKWIVKSIGLDERFEAFEPTNNFLLTKQHAKRLARSRKYFAHKGNYGHALLMMGSKGKVGAAVLSARACMRSGSGLTTIYSPSCGYDILQTSVPEAMVITDEQASHIASSPPIDEYQAIGVGCGIGMEKETQQAIYNVLRLAKQPLVLDADALNLLALDPRIYSEIPPNSILTPHPKEFERLFGKTDNDFQRNDLQRQKAIELKCYILLKGANSCIATPEGNCYFNTTGNPGMATGGSGDVLTGIITGLLAQGYASEDALCLGVYLHGLAGDLAVKELGEESLIAGDLIAYLPKAFLKLKQPYTPQK